MHAELENWNNGWFGVRLAMRPREIRHLIGLLNKLLDDPDQHFHMTSNYAGESGLGDIELSVASDENLDNMKISGLAMGPDSEVETGGA